ncbi:MAG: hypothetical protein K6E19_00745 [Lachnospiraceae bacterium]|nr:hypothetical protein [Lachnospiraceae bacterium]
MAEDRYFLTSDSFNAEVSRGAIVSLRHSRVAKESEFVLPDTLFGELILTYEKEKGEAPVIWKCNRTEGYTDAEPAKSGNGLCYEWNVKDDRSLLTVTSRIEVLHNRLTQTYSIKNEAQKPVRILDAALSISPNSSFEWGDSAAEKVIAHNFTGGHGSHSLITRCDGKGAYLLVMPLGKWEFFDQGADLDLPTEENKYRNRIFVYEYSRHEAGEARSHGFKERIGSSDLTLEPDEETTVGFAYEWATDYEDARDRLVANNIPDIMAIPGYTVPADSKVKIAVRFNGQVRLEPEFPGDTEWLPVSNGDTAVYELSFSRSGENYVDIRYGEDKFVRTEFFVTESIRTMIEKRGAFIAKHAVCNENLWYDGLLAEWNNETGVELGPDNYDKIKGWRIYEVTCDDPGLSKPAFLSGKLSEYPVQSEVDVLDHYIDKFVWGGLQCTEEENYPYGIYGIPDWNKNRNSDDPGNGGREHLWRIYDYPHIAIMYYNMYTIAKRYSNIRTKLTAEEYLERAFRTAVAMFTIPLELEEWSAYETGLYNELVIPKIIEALKKEGFTAEARRLERHWNRKVKFFVSKSRDLFGSEYPFDTTGFESTHALARTALEIAELKKREDRFNPQIAYSDARAFLENQISCNVACRGYLEPAYFWYGSDYRGNNHHYTLSYMSQMGGWALLDYALYFAEDPFPLLRLGYGSLLSSWALLNSGTAGSDYGFFFPGKENDGAASGGFEPLPYGETWLQQPHSSGAWYYSCEIDLGFCGALRGACTIFAEDPVFGFCAYGGSLAETESGYELISEDGIGRRFHVIIPEGRLHVIIENGRFRADEPIVIGRNFETIIIPAESMDPALGESKVTIEVSGDGAFKDFEESYSYDGQRIVFKRA